MTSTPDLHEFFRQYALVSLGPEPEKLAGYYEPSFLVAGPKGGATFKNDHSFQTWLKSVHEANLKSGMIGMAPGEISATPVGGSYTFATVTWAATFQAKPESPIEFKVSYLVREANDSPKIAAYVDHEDQEAAMKRHGLL